MKLFVKCHQCNSKIYIQSSARVRSELPYQFNLRCNQISCFKNKHDDIYTQYDVLAEPGDANATSSMIVLGALGALIAGGPGAVVGGLIGALAGSQSEQPDREAVERFNRS